MASFYCSSSARPTQSIQGFHNLVARPHSSPLKALNFTPNVHLPPLNFRFKNSSRLSISQKLRPLYASNSPSEGSLPEKPEESKTVTSSTAQGPPIPTILAGFVVLFFVFWIVKSIALWLLSLVFTFPASK